MYNPIILETPRLIIREFTLDDLDNLHALQRAAWNDDETTREERERWLRWTTMNYRELANMYQPPYGDRAVTLKDSGELVGVVGIVPAGLPFGAVRHYVPDGYRENDLRIVPEFGLYWATHPTHRKQGYAAEAGSAMIDLLFDRIWVRRVIATTSYDNEGSMAVMRKLGMSIEKNPFKDPFWFEVVGILDYDPARPITTQFKSAQPEGR